MGRDAEENRVKKARQEKSGEKSTDHSGGNERACPTQDELKDVAARRAERETNADFLVTLRHKIGDHAVDAERGEAECEDRENPDQPGTETRLRNRGVDEVLHRVDLHDHERIKLANCAARSGRDHGGAGGANDEVQIARDKLHELGPDLGVGHVKHAGRWFIERAMFNVATNPLNREPVAKIHDPLADRALVRPVTFRQLLANNCHAGCALVVTLGEIGAGFERNPERAEVTGTDRANLRRVASPLVRPSFDVDAVAPIVCSRRSPDPYDT